MEPSLENNSSPAGAAAAAPAGDARWPPSAAAAPSPPSSSSTEPSEVAPGRQRQRDLSGGGVHLMRRLSSTASLDADDEADASTPTAVGKNTAAATVAHASPSRAVRPAKDTSGDGEERRPSNSASASAVAAASSNTEPAAGRSSSSSSSFYTGPPSLSKPAVSGGGGGGGGVDGDAGDSSDARTANPPQQRQQASQHAALSQWPPSRRPSAFNATASPSPLAEGAYASPSPMRTAASPSSAAAVAAASPSVPTASALQQYGCCVFFFPTPVLSWIFPLAGHVAISNAEGTRLYTFESSYFVREERMVDVLDRVCGDNWDAQSSSSRTGSSSRFSASCHRQHHRHQSADDSDDGTASFSASGSQEVRLSGGSSVPCSPVSPTIHSASTHQQQQQRHLQMVNNSHYGSSGGEEEPTDEVAASSGGLRSRWPFFSRKRGVIAAATAAASGSRTPTPGGASPAPAPSPAAQPRPLSRSLLASPNRRHHLKRPSSSISSGSHSHTRCVRIWDLKPLLMESRGRGSQRVWLPMALAATSVSGGGRTASALWQRLQELLPAEGGSSGNGGATASPSTSPFTRPNNSSGSGGNDYCSVNSGSEAEDDRYGQLLDRDTARYYNRNLQATINIFRGSPEGSNSSPDFLVQHRNSYSFVGFVLEVCGIGGGHTLSPAPPRSGEAEKVVAAAAAEAAEARPPNGKTAAGDSHKDAFLLPSALRSSSPATTTSSRALVPLPSSSDGPSGDHGNNNVSTSSSSSSSAADGPARGSMASSPHLHPQQASHSPLSPSSPFSSSPAATDADIAVDGISWGMSKILLNVSLFGEWRRSDQRVWRVMHGGTLAGAMVVWAALLALLYLCALPFLAPYWAGGAALAVATATAAGDATTTAAAAEAADVVFSATASASLL